MFNNKKNIMKKYWILLTAIALVALGFVLITLYPDGTLTKHYFSAGDYACGVFAAGTFSIGVFSIGIFSIGIFSIGIFNIGIYAIGIFVLAYRKNCLQKKSENCEC